jgi:hypothetical protein
MIAALLTSPIVRVIDPGLARRAGRASSQKSIGPRL